MADYYLIRKVDGNGGTSFEVYEALGANTAATVKTRQNELFCLGHLKTVTYHEVTAVSSNDVVKQKK